MHELENAQVSLFNGQCSELDWAVAKQRRELGRPVVEPHREDCRRSYWWSSFDHSMCLADFQFKLMCGLGIPESEANAAINASIRAASLFGCFVFDPVTRAPLGFTRAGASILGFADLKPMGLTG